MYEIIQRNGMLTLDSLVLNTEIEIWRHVRIDNQYKRIGAHHKGKLPKPQKTKRFISSNFMVKREPHRMALLPIKPQSY